MKRMSYFSPFKKNSKTPVQMFQENQEHFGVQEVEEEIEEQLKVAPGEVEG